MYIHAWIYIYLHRHTPHPWPASLHQYSGMHTHTNTHLHTHTHTWAINTPIHLYARVTLNRRIYIHTHTHTHVHTHTYIHTRIIHLIHESCRKWQQKLSLWWVISHSFMRVTFFINGWHDMTHEGWHDSCKSCHSHSWVMSLSYASCSCTSNVPGGNTNSQIDVS